MRADRTVMKNDPSKAGCLASEPVLFGPFNRYKVAAVHTRFDAVQWFVWDAEGGHDESPAVIRQAESLIAAVWGLVDPHERSLLTGGL